MEFDEIDEKQKAGIHYILHELGWVISENTDKISKYRPLCAKSYSTDPVVNTNNESHRGHFPRYTTKLHSQNKTS